MKRPSRSTDRPYSQTVPGWWARGALARLSICSSGFTLRSLLSDRDPALGTEPGLGIGVFHRGIQRPAIDEPRSVPKQILYSHLAIRRHGRIGHAGEFAVGTSHTDLLSLKRG